MADSDSESEIPHTVTVDENGVKWGEDKFGKYRVEDRVWTMNEIRDHPMFMEDVPSDISDNPHLLALQNLIYDGQTPEQLAEHFRQLGNEAFRSSTNKVSNQNALMAYTKGLEMECKDKSLNSQLHSNRAAVSMRMKANDKAIDDCRRAIELDPKNTKAWFRGAKASEALGITEQGLKFCEGALETSPDDQQLKTLQSKLKKQFAKEQEQHRLRRKAEAAEQAEHSIATSSVKAVLEKRGVQVGPILFDVAMYFQGRQPEPYLASDAADAVQWPLLMLYDETCQSDFVEVFDERCALSEQFENMFPKDRRVDWDEEGKYVWDRLVAYLEHYPAHGSGTRMLRVKTDEPLQSALENLHVPKVLSIHVLVEGSGALESFCREHHIAP
mmetsp:Transcript_38267/g.101213  ORF Transcript_38267/g.101213 Transcript_38267/m.101213 type:complete len:385 (-) Transcript_38267:98-1252(-)